MVEDDLFGGISRAQTSDEEISVPLPWHEKPWSLLTNDLSRLPHALLLTGRDGLGKAQFAQRLARTLLCLRPRVNHDACGTCRSCALLAADTHPDFTVVAPAEEGRAISVDQIRELGEFLALTPHTAARKLVIILPAEAMNINAANSLLKQLEEPPLGSVLILVSSQSERLPPTIRSRCTKVNFQSPASELACRWLAGRGVAGPKAQILLDLSSGAPLRALTLHEEGGLDMREAVLGDLEALGAAKADVVTCAARWKGLGTARALDWLHTAIADIARMVLGGRAGVRVVNTDLAPRLHKIGKDIQFKQLFEFLDQISASRASLRGPLDEQLAIESLLVHWTRLAR